MLGLALLFLLPEFAPPPSAQAELVRSYGPGEMSSIKALVDTIDGQALTADVRALQNTGTRYASSRGNLQAATRIAGWFRAAGLRNVSFEEFSYYDDQTGTYATTRNVVASKPGARTPERIVVVGAHFDSITRSADDGRVSALDAENPSPGADDNATGVAAVLAAARLFGPLTFDCTLRFVAFSAEEPGIFGSAYHAARAARAQERIVAMINLDMIGYTKQDPEDLDILANGQSTWLLDRITNNARVYAPGLPVYRAVDDRYDGSDHAPFWTNGYPAVCFMEDYYPSSKLYHTPRDTVDTLDIPFFVRCTRLAVANLAELAGIHVADAAPVTGAEVGAGPADWRRESGRRFLFTLSSDANRATAVDVSLPDVSAKASVSLGDVPAETWGQPRNYPTALCRKPGSTMVFVSSIKLRPSWKDSGRGSVQVVDARSMRVVASFVVGANPTAGCFDVTGAKYYQPYWGEKGIDVFDARTLARVDRIATPLSLSKVAVDRADGLAVGISTETSEVAIIDLAKRSVVAVLATVPSPTDVVLADHATALVCSEERGAIYRVDLTRQEEVEEVRTPLRPVHLIVSPEKDVVASIHRLGSQVGLFRIVRLNGEAGLEAWKVLDLGEVIVDGAFAGEDLCYLISSSKCRLFGLHPSSGKTVWAMRTGGVRAQADTDRMVFVGQ
jgi:hypothetical protein